MAIPTHVAQIGLVQVAPDGTVFRKGSAKINQFLDRNDGTLSPKLSFSTEHRVLEDPAIPTTSGFPTIKEYVEAEALADYQLMHLDQYIIVTQLLP